jgi:heterodisulfide reductase subunit B
MVSGVGVMSNFSDLAKKINEENHKAETLSQEAQPFKSVLDNSETEELIEKARQSLIAEKNGSDAKTSINGATGTSSGGQKTAQQGSSPYTRTTGSTQTSGGAQPYRSPYVGSNTYNKPEDIDDKARKYSKGCVQTSMESIKKTKNNWDIVTAVNQSFEDRHKSAQQLLKEQKKQDRKETRAQLLLEFGCLTIENFYKMLGGKK